MIRGKLKIDTFEKSFVLSRKITQHFKQKQNLFLAVYKTHLYRGY